MPDILKILSTEVDIELSDKRNEVLEDLLSNVYFIGDSQIAFKASNIFLYDGIAEIKNRNYPNLKAMFTVYIQNMDIYISLYTLDLVKLIDVPSHDFSEELKILFSNDRHKKPRKPMEAGG